MRNSVLSRGNRYIPQKLGSLGILEHRSFGKEAGVGGEALRCRPVLGVLPLEFSLSQGRAIHVLSPRRPGDPHPSHPHPASPAGLLPPNPPAEWGSLCVRELSPPDPPRLFLATSQFSGFYAASSVGISWPGQKRTEDQQAGRYLGSFED